MPPHSLRSGVTGKTADRAPLTSGSLASLVSALFLGVQLLLVLTAPAFVTAPVIQRDCKVAVTS